MTGRLRRKAQARSIHLLWNRSDGMTIQKLKWSPQMVREELVAMLQRAQLAPLDLVRAWDQSEDFSFSSREFLVSNHGPSNATPASVHTHSLCPIPAATKIVCMHSLLSHR